MPVTIDQILERAAEEKASDIILSAGMPPVIMVVGKMCYLGNRPLESREIQSLVYKLLEKEQIARFERERELDFSLTFKDNSRFRGNAFWQRSTVGVALRLVPTEIPKIEDLGLPPKAREFADSNQGLILVTGPTGHGKSTTMAAMIGHINHTRCCHIITVEDPIEFVHTNDKSVIEQREVGSDTLSFASALRHSLRQAPHVILVGEMRDMETISVALTAAETGHLVFATLHTNDGPQAVHRIIDVFPPHQQSQIRAQLSSSLLAVLAQRLLPDERDGGRILACEVVINTPAIANLIRENKVAHIQGILETQGKLGMISMDAAIKKLYLDMRITEETAKRAMKHPQILFG